MPLPTPREEDVAAIARRKERVCERIAKACQRVGRSVDEVTLVGVTKSFSLGTIAAALEAGIHDLGENKVQEWYSKAEAAPPDACRWHMIGHLQRNKARMVVHKAYMFHALDSLRLADSLDRRAREQGRVLPCLVQVNISGEATKFGIAPQAVDSMLRALATRTHLAIGGLMTLAAPAADPEAVRPQFRQMRRLLETASLEGRAILSMGMSGDFEVAIEEGATHIRIGSALFGPRNRPNPL